MARTWWLWRDYDGDFGLSVGEPFWNSLNGWTLPGAPFFCDYESPILDMLIGDLPEPGQLWKMRGAEFVAAYEWKD